MIREMFQEELIEQQEKINYQAKNNKARKNKARKNKSRIRWENLFQKYKSKNNKNNQANLKVNK